MENSPQSDKPRKSVSGQRKTLYYLGMGVMVIGFVLFISVFFSGLSMMNSGPLMMGVNPGGVFLRGVIGLLMVIAGRLMMNAGARGLAGSGVLLDPQQAREDLEPWARMGGGMVKDALDEAGLNQTNPSGQTAALTFDEKLRRLEDLRRDGLLTEDEYRQKRAEILEKGW